MPDIEVRLAHPGDAAQILGIYAHYVENTTVSFEEAVPTIQEFSSRIANISEKYPYIVLTVDGVVRAYTYASQYRARAAYRFDVETSIYMAHELCGMGIGKIMYTALFELLPEMNYYNAYAGITQPNAKSTKMHESMGFTAAGTWYGTGFKHGRWVDVKLLQKALRPRDEVPEEPLAVVDLPEALIKRVFSSCTDKVRQTMNKA